MQGTRTQFGTQAQTSHQCCAHPRPGRSPPTGCGVAAHSVARAPQASAGRKHTGRGARRGEAGRRPDRTGFGGRATSTLVCPKGGDRPCHTRVGRTRKGWRSSLMALSRPCCSLRSQQVSPNGVRAHLQVSQQGTRGRAWAFYSKKKQQSLWPLYKLRFER